MQTLTIGDLSGCFLFICVTPKQTVATHKVVYSFSLLTFTSEKVPQRPRGHSYTEKRELQSVGHCPATGCPSGASVTPLSSCSRRAVVEQTLAQTCKHLSLRTGRTKQRSPAWGGELYRMSLCQAVCTHKNSRFPSYTYVRIHI